VIAGAAAAVILVAGGTAAALTLTRDKDQPSGAATTAGPSAAGPTAGASAAAPPAAAPMPSNTILVRQDTGADDSKNRVTRIVAFEPGTDTRTPLAGSKNGDVLPKWSHDRQTVAVTYRKKDGTNEIYLMDRTGQNRRKILEDVSLGRVAWSPDDTKLAFMRSRNGVNQIFLQTLDDSDAVQLTTGAEQKDDPAFTADGESIVYWRITGKVRQIFELNVAAPKEPGRRIVGPDNGPANDPMPSPDGKTLLYTREADAKVTTSDIWLINMDGTGARRLTSDPAREMDATWSPDGTWFAYVRGAYERPTVVAMRPDGTGETLLTKPGQREGHPCWF
jgi:Tol biopolymer transport system component